GGRRVAATSAHSGHVEAAPTGRGRPGDGLRGRDGSRDRLQLRGPSRAQGARTPTALCGGPRRTRRRGAHAGRTPRHRARRGAGRVAGRGDLPRLPGRRGRGRVDPVRIHTRRRGGEAVTALAPQPVRVADTLPPLTI